MADIPSPLKWHGGKHYLASRIVALMPPHRVYVEPYAGGLSVLLARPNRGEGVCEVVNDLDRHLANFWQVLGQPMLVTKLQRCLESTPFSEDAWAEAGDGLAMPGWDSLNPDNMAVNHICVYRAAWFFVRCRQSLAGRMTTFAPLSTARTRRGMCEQVSAWLTAVEGLPAVHERLKRVAVLNRPALDVIRQCDTPNTLFYLDPPYYPASRTAPAVYRHEMTHDDHVRLLATVRGVQGRVMLSGYRCELYDGALSDWRRVDFSLPNHSASGPTKRRMVESVWLNYDPPKEADCG